MVETVWSTRATAAACWAASGVAVQGGPAICMPVSMTMLIPGQGMAPAAEVVVSENDPEPPIPGMPGMVVVDPDMSPIGAIVVPVEPEPVMAAMPAIDLVVDPEAMVMAPMVDEVEPEPLLIAPIVSDEDEPMVPPRPMAAMVGPEPAPPAMEPMAMSPMAMVLVSLLARASACWWWPPPPGTGRWPWPSPGGG